MSVRDQSAYCLAFVDCLRMGPPVRFARKQAQGTEQFVWHTQGGEKVTLSYRPKDGHILRCDEPPDTTYPGEDHNFDAKPSPIFPAETESAYHSLGELEATPPYHWADTDFVAHYYLGGCTPVTLAAI